MKQVPSGLEAIIEIVPNSTDTASAIGNTGIDVVSTVALILYVESASHELVAPYYEPGEATVGIRVELDHVAAARVGEPVEVRATLEQVIKRRLVFSNEVRQGGKTVMHGHHHRSLVQTRDFSTAATADKQPAPVDFWFDFHSPWCYLAASRIAAIATARGALLRWRPVHLANLIDRIDGRRPLEGSAAFVSWYEQDIRDQAAELRLPYRPHPDYPLRPSRALRVALLAAGHGQAARFVPAVMRAYWADGKDISNIEVLVEIGLRCGLDAAAVRAAAVDATARQTLLANMDEAVAAQVFGLPTAIVDGKRFFGNDHLDLLDKYLARR